MDTPCISSQYGVNDHLVLGGNLMVTWSSQRKLAALNSQPAHRTSHLTRSERRASPVGVSQSRSPKTISESLSGFRSTVVGSASWIVAKSASSLINVSYSLPPSGAAEGEKHMKAVPGREKLWLREELLEYNSEITNVSGYWRGPHTDKHSSQPPALHTDQTVPDCCRAERSVHRFLYKTQCPMLYSFDHFNWHNFAKA